MAYAMMMRAEQGNGMQTIEAMKIHVDHNNMLMRADQIMGISSIKTMLIQAGQGREDRRQSR